MKELDVLLEAYLRCCYSTAGRGERRAFEALLSAPDPQLWAYILGQEQPERREERRVIERLRRAAGA